MEIVERIEKAVETAVTKIGTDLGKTNASLDALGTRLDKLEARGNRQPAGGGDAPPLIVKSLMDAPGFQALKGGATSSGRILLPGSYQSLRKNLMSIQTGGSPNQGWDVLPQRYPGVGEDPRRVLTLLDVLPHLQVNSNVWEFHQLEGYANAAADQGAESLAKAQATIPFSLVAARILTYAHYIKASKQVLEDAPLLQAYVSSLLTYGVRLKIEQDIVAGATVGSLLGLLNQAIPFVTSAAKAADMISEAQAALAALGWTAGLVILHPLDWAKIRSERSTTSYFSGGWVSPPNMNIWGLNLVTTPSITQGNAIVMAPDAVAVLDRSSVSVMVGYDQDDFTKNMVTILAEARTGFAAISNGAILRFPLAF